MVLALLWQLAHAVLLAPVNVHSCTELESLLLPGEEHSAAPDELLFRWLNHHLHQVRVRGSRVRGRVRVRTSSSSVGSTTTCTRSP